MDTKTVVEIALAAVGLIAALIGVIYGLLRSEDKRLSRNIHELRNAVHELAIQVATWAKRR